MQTSYLLSGRHSQSYLYVAVVETDLCSGHLACLSSATDNKRPKIMKHWTLESGSKLKDVFFESVLSCFICMSFMCFMCALLETRL